MFQEQTLENDYIQNGCISVILNILHHEVNYKLLKTKQDEADFIMEYQNESNRVLQMFMIFFIKWVNYYNNCKYRKKMYQTKLFKRIIQKLLDLRMSCKD